MSVFERCLEKCRARKGAVVYSDGEDRRVVSAAAKLIREGLVEPILIGDPEKVRAALQESGETGVSLQVVNPYNPALLQHNAAEYMSIQKDKGKDISEEEAIKAVKNPLAAGALMVRRGEAEIGVAREPVLHGRRHPRRPAHGRHRRPEARPCRASSSC